VPRLPRAALGPSIVVLMMLAGCSILTGASDLTIDSSLAGKDGGTSSDSPPGEAGGDGGRDAAPIVGEDAGVDAAPTSRLREVTFESGLLLGTNGADTSTGTPFVSPDFALRGKYSMLVGTSVAFVEITFPEADEIYASFAFAVATFPAARGVIARFSFADPSTTLDFSIAENAGMIVKLGGSSVGIGGVLQVGPAYRVGVHIARTGGGMTIRAQVADGAATVLDGKGSGVTVGSLGGVKRIALGAIDTELSGVFDQLLVDTVAMPAP
jgi:hypothetical protein